MPVYTGMTVRGSFGDDKNMSFRRGPSRNPEINNDESPPRLPGGGREPGINKYWMPVCTGMTDRGDIRR